MDKMNKIPNPGIGKTIDILMKINDKNIEYVACKTGKLPILVINIINGKLAVDEKFIESVCNLFDIDQETFYYLVRYYNSLDITLPKIVKHKLLLSYSLKLLFDFEKEKISSKFNFEEYEDEFSLDEAYDIFSEAESKHLVKKQKRIKIWKKKD